MNILNSEALQSLGNDKAQLELRVFELIKDFEKKYEGSNIGLIMETRDYKDGKWFKTGMKSKVEIMIDGQKMEIK
jgi:hypothetical protein